MSVDIEPGVDEPGAEGVGLLDGVVPFGPGKVIGPALDADRFHLRPVVLEGRVDVTRVLAQLRDGEADPGFFDRVPIRVALVAGNVDALWCGVWYRHGRLLRRTDGRILEQGQPVRIAPDAQILLARVVRFPDIVRRPEEQAGRLGDLGPHLQAGPLVVALVVAVPFADQDRFVREGVSVGLVACAHGLGAAVGMQADGIPLIGLVAPLVQVIPVGSEPRPETSA
jgi:hypothetical protein